MFLFAFILLSGVVTGHAQVKKTGPDAGPLVGMWQYVEEVVTSDGGKAYIGKQIFKTITEDNTYSVILGVNIPVKEANWEESKTSTLAFITQEGETTETTPKSSTLLPANSLSWGWGKS